VLRFHPCCAFDETEEGITIYNPALIAAFRPIVGDDETVPPQAIHRIFLNPDGSKIAKKMLAPVTGCAVKLDGDDNVTQGLGIAEGIETALAVRATGWRPLWALGSEGAIRLFPLLPGIEALTIFADNDASGIGKAAARECGQRWADAGREVIIRTPFTTGCDWEDALSC
jgi:putative DNA primase/helicase